MSQYADLILLAFVAVAIGYKLYNMLGTDVGAEIKNDKEKIITPVEIVKESEITKREEFPEDIRKTITTIQNMEPGFSLPELMDKAEKVFEYILQTISQRNIEEIKLIVSDKVYKQFSKFIDDLRSKNIFVKITLVSISEQSIEKFIVNGNEAIIKVKFVTHQIVSHQDDAGNNVTGNKNIVEKKEDIWTFSKKLGDGSKIWLLEEAS